MATVDLTASSFTPAVEDNDILFVDFWAGWCGPCLAFAPTYQAASDSHPDVVFAKVDTEAEQELSAAAGITSIPTLMVFREQILVFSQPGALSPPQLDSVLAAVKGLDMDEVRKSIVTASDDA